MAEVMYRKTTCPLCKEITGDWPSSFSPAQTTRVCGDCGEEYNLSEEGVTTFYYSEPVK